MTALTANLSASAEVIDIDTALTPGTRFLRIDDELVEVVNPYEEGYHAYQRDAPNPLRVAVVRAREGTTAASHLAAATVTAYADAFATPNPFAAGGATSPLELESDGAGDPMVVVNRDGGANDGAFLFEITPDGSVLITSEDPATSVLDVRPLVAMNSGKSIVFIRPSSGTHRVRVSKEGHLNIKAPAVPTDAEIFSSECAFWFDDTNGAAKIKFKGKTADGTVVSGEVSLT